MGMVRAVEETWILAISRWDGLYLTFKNESGCDPKN